VLDDAAGALAGGAAGAIDESGFDDPAGAGVELLHPLTIKAAERRKLAARTGNFAPINNLLLPFSIESNVLVLEQTSATRGCPQMTSSPHDPSDVIPHRLAATNRKPQMVKIALRTKNHEPGNKLKQHLPSEIERLRRTWLAPPLPHLSLRARPELRVLTLNSSH
jgi:hypothetical protein